MHPVEFFYYSYSAFVGMKHLAVGQGIDKGFLKRSKVVVTAR